MNPLLSPTPLEISPAEEQAQMLELAEQNDASLYDLQRRKANIERKRQDLDIERKEENLQSVEWLNKRIYGLISSVTDPNTTERVAEKIATGKDLNEFVKAAQGVVKLRDDLLDHTYDDTAQSGKKKKIDFAFQGGGYRIGMRIEADE